MAALGEELTQPVGPLPAVAWAGILVGGVVAYKYYKNRSGTAKTTTVVASDSLPTSGQNLADATGVTAGYIAAANTVNSAGSTTVTNNVQWLTQAANWLIGHGNDPSVVESMVADYQAGNKLSAQETSLLNQALQQFGSPPEGPINAGTQTSPVGTPTPAPTPIPVSTVPPFRRQLQMGDSGPDVAQVQHYISAPETGVFDQATSDHVWMWQGIHGLPQTRVVNKPTWQSIFGEPAFYANTPGTPFANTPYKAA